VKLVIAEPPLYSEEDQSRTNPDDVKLDANNDFGASGTTAGGVRNTTA
jgi:hypothetical protein